MPNVRSRDKAPIVIYIERPLLDAMRRHATALGITLVDLQADYLERHCERVSRKTARRKTTPADR